MLLASLFYLWRHTLSHQESHHRFDYVIICGGPGGSTLANRLTEDPSITLALVEAGIFYEDFVGNKSTVPGYNFLYAMKSANETIPFVYRGCF